MDRDVLSAEAHLLALRSLGGQQYELRNGKISLLKRLDHLITDGAGGAGYRHAIFLFRSHCRIYSPFSPAIVLVI